jgi:chorismate mutase
MTSPSRIRAVRGATTVPVDTPDEIRAATRELLAEIAARNDIAPDDIVSALFTVTADLRSEFPARAARDLGWTDVPLLCTVEIPVPGALARCVRVLLHAETTRPRDQIRHVYLREARALRPDLSGD